MFEGFAERKIDVGDVEISCVIGGSGPPLLLLHGFPQNKSMWARVAPKLVTNYTVICADLRGYGDSSKPRCHSGPWRATNSTSCARLVSTDFT
jgi:haloacetate dehalogenase